MAMREEFDQYLLLKKIAEDPLGETFRAGRIGDGSLDQVVLLRVLNGPRVDAAALARELPERDTVQQALKSPNIGNGVGVGVYRNVPYLAYDYISGRNLASLIQQADQQLNPVAADQALLIAERIGLALAVAYETRIGGDRLGHGFLLPHLIRISNEGETRVLGFEAGPLLARQAVGGTFEPEVSAYLAPELLAGDGFDKSDDVYSLGAILYELLTGVRYTGNASTLGAATLAGEGTPLPPPVAELLRRSLAPRGERIAEPVSWHKALTRVMQDGGYNANTFNLAFFMHNLFRSDIEQETAEMEAEKDIEPPATPAATTLAVPRDEVAAAPAVAGAPFAGADATGTTHIEPAEKKGGKGALIGIAAALLIALAVGAWWLLGRGGEEPETQVAETTAPVTAPVEPAAPEPQGPTPEELEAQLQAMIEARSQEMEEKLKSQYDDRIRNLQGELDTTREAAAEREAARRAEVERKESERAAALAAEKKAADEEAARKKQQQEEAARKAQEEADRLAQEEADRKAAEEKALQAAQAAAPAKVTTPQIVDRPEPRYPALAKRAQRDRATVVLRVLVDTDGRVIQVEQISKKVGFGIDVAAANAAKQARYRPGTSDGKPEEMWTVLRFDFQP